MAASNVKKQKGGARFGKGKRPLCKHTPVMRCSTMAPSKEMNNTRTAFKLPEAPLSITMSVRMPGLDAGWENDDRCSRYNTWIFQILCTLILVHRDQGRTHALGAVDSKAV